MNGRNASRVMYMASAMIVGLMILLTVVSHSAQAATIAGTTVGLTNAGQSIRDASSAVPLIGFSMTATTPGEALDLITVSFSGAGFDAGDDNDLRALNTLGGQSGVALYRDDGAVDDALDAGDTPVALDGIMWIGNNVEMDLTGHSEAVPLTVAGSYHWFIIIRTSDVAGTLANGDQIRAQINANAIVATSGAGLVTQPATAVAANTLIVRLTRTVDMLQGTDRWIGPSSASTSSMAVLGLSIIDGGIAMNHGIQDRIERLTLTLTETGGAVSSIDFQPLSTDAADSGIAFYWDSGTVDDRWDAADAPIGLGSIAPMSFGPGGATLTVIFQSPGLDVPDVNTGLLDMFVVVRTADISTGDSFTLEISANDIIVNGALAPQAGSVDAGLTTPMPLWSTVVPSSNVMGDSTPPILRNLQWIETSPYLAAINRDLYFNHLMTSTQYGDVTGQARDDDSGLALVVFSAEPSLASSPGAMSLTGANIWRSWAGSYGLSNLSTDASSPATVTVFDQVGNQITTSDLERDFYYHYSTEPILIRPNPGWVVQGGPPVWVDPTGKLWFSHLIYGTVTATVQVDIVSLFGGGLTNASASTEPSLADGPDPALVSYGAGTDAATFTVDYEIGAGSTDASSPVTIIAYDNIGNSASANFSYGLDAVGPSISFLSPSQGAAISGTFTVRAIVTDPQTTVERVEVEVDPMGGFQTMYFDGTAYFYPISSALYADGDHRVIIRAVDAAGNENVLGVDVSFHNSGMDTVPPEVAFVAPIQHVVISATTIVRVLATDNLVIARVDLQIGAAPPLVMTLNSTSGYYESAWDTTSLPDGEYHLSATAVDAFGNKGGTLGIDVTVDNTAPVVSLAAPVSGEKVNGVFVFRVFASDTVGIKTVSLEVFGSTVMMAYNSATGYYEYIVDTRSVPDGTYAARVIVEDFAEHTTTTPQASFKVQNKDYVHALFDVAPLLIFFFLVAAFGLILLLARRGTLAKWLGKERPTLKDEPKAKE